MLFVVVVRVIVILVVFSLLLLMLPRLLLLGTMALRYWTTYAIRGGPSSSGLYCGAFCVYQHYGAGSAYWYVGAVITTYARRGGDSSDNIHCGAFFNVYSTLSLTYWGVGAVITTYAMRGGRSNIGDYCGLFFNYFVFGIGNKAWDYGAILHMLCVVVARTMGPFVVLFVLVWTLVSGVRFGPVALPYHLN